MADVNDAVEFMRHSEDAESENRQLGLQALKFRYGEQWPQYAIASRGIDRPQLTINETNVYIKKICNMQRQQRPRGKASPVGDRADKKIAKVITGLGRHIEVSSDADNAYDTAFDFAATIGWGYWRLNTDYTAADSFNQDICIRLVDNPFSVYFDPASVVPDGSDAKKCLIAKMMRKSQFKKMYPDAMANGFQQRGTGDSDADWMTAGDEGSIRVAEYYYIDRTPSQLFKLSDGAVFYRDDLPPIELLQKAGLEIIGSRESYTEKVMWQKQTAFEILEKKDLHGKWIPVVPVYWTRVMIDGRRMCMGLVKDAMDPARLNNFWKTAITEYLALAPKAKWLIADGQDEGHEVEFKQANLSNAALLRYKPTTLDGQPVPPPQRIQPEPPPAGLIEATFMATQDLSKVMGVFDPAVRGGAQHKSDKTLNAERGQSENTNFDGYDNLTRSIKHTWRIMLSWFPKIYDTQRVQRIIGEDGRDSVVMLNEKQPQLDQSGQPVLNDEGQAIMRVLNDVTVGEYDVVMETGPGYDTKRQEGVDAMMQLLDTPLGEKVAMVADDLVVRNLDFNGADLIADRLAAANPLSQVDEKSDVPPQAQMMIQGLQANLQKATQTIQALQTEIKLKTGIEQMRQDGETTRAHLAATVRAHDSLERSASNRHDAEVRAMASQGNEEIKAVASILLAHIDTAQLEREIAARNMELERVSAQPTPANGNGAAQ